MVRTPDDRFYLVFRSLDLEHHGTIKLPPYVALTLATSQRIRYCPRCGKNVEKHYRKQSGLECVDEVPDLSIREVGD